MRTIDEINAELQRELDGIEAAKAMRITMLLVELSEAKTERMLEILRRNDD